MSVVVNNIDAPRFLEQNPISGKDWSRIGACRRSGIATPLAAIYSDSSTGIADFNDLKLLIDFIHETGGSIAQVLPFNCTGFNHAPYSAESGFALDAVYASFNEGDIKGIRSSRFQKEIDSLKTRFPIATNPDGTSRVNYGIKKAKLELLEKMFLSRSWHDETSFQKFKNETAKYWLDDYVLYRVLKEKNNEKSWEDWEPGHRDRDANELFIFTSRAKNSDRLEFHRWVQWQLFEQMKAVRKYAEDKDVLIMGDLPFLPSRDSADVWATREKNYFNLDLQAGALPDFYFADGQCWGNPPPNWEIMENIGDFEYIRQKRRYASNFYHIERKDHEIGQSRLWVIPRGKKATEGFFYPSGTQLDERSERAWQRHHQKLLQMQIGDPLSKMLYTSEGLGVPPQYMRETLSEFGVPDILPAIWTKDGPDFIDRGIVGIGTLSVHDSAIHAAQIEKELGTLDRGMLKNMCTVNGVPHDDVVNSFFDDIGTERLRWKKGIREDDLGNMDWLKEQHKNTFDERERYLRYIGWNGPDVPSHEMIKRALQRSLNTSAVFAIPSIFDVESLKEDGLELARHHRYNMPGICDPQRNWNLRNHRSLNQMLSDDEYITGLRQMHVQTARAI